MIVYFLMYLIALGLLTFEVIRLAGIVDQVFIATLFTNLSTENVLVFYAILAIPVLFFIWFFTLVLILAPSEARRQLFLCFIPLTIFLLVGFYAIMALLYMAVTFIGIYMTAVGSGIGGYQDAREKKGIGRFIALVGVIVGLIIEVLNQGMLDFILPFLKDAFAMPILGQSASPAPSGYGIGYYVTAASIIYSLYKTTKESWELRRDILQSGATASSGGVLGLVMNPIFLAFWILSTALFFPLLPFVYLNWGITIIYLLGWVTAKF